MEAVRPKQKRKSKDERTKKSSKSNEKAKQTLSDDSATSSHQEHLYVTDVSCKKAESISNEVENVLQIPKESVEKIEGEKSQVDGDGNLKINLVILSDDENLKGNSIPMTLENTNSFSQSLAPDCTNNLPKSLETSASRERLFQRDVEYSDEAVTFKCSESLGLQEATEQSKFFNRNDITEASHDQHLVKLMEATEQSEILSQDVREQDSEQNSQVTRNEDDLQIEAPSCPEHSILPAVITPPYSITRDKREQSKIESRTVSHIIPRLYPSLQEVTKEFESIQPFSEEQLLQLYQNSLLESNEVFIENFVQHEKNPENDPFYELVRTYLRSRNNLTSSHLENSNFHKRTKQQEGNLWALIPDIVTQSGRCLDGKSVSGYHKFIRAKFNDEALSILSQTLQQLREHVQDTLTLHVYTAELSRLQIETYIQTLLSSVTFREIPRNAPVTGFLPHERSALQTDHVCTLQCCISVLFNFHRRVVTDRIFVTDVRDWLTKLVAVLLRAATLHDHLFILNHVLRCPAGIANWAAQFIQPPTPLWPDGSVQLPSFSSLFLDHALVTLSTLLLPIKARASCGRTCQ